MSVNHLQPFKGNLTVGHGGRGRTRKRPTQNTASSPYVFEGGSPKADEYPEFAPSRDSTFSSKQETAHVVKDESERVSNVESQQNPLFYCNKTNTGLCGTKKKKGEDLFPAWEDPSLGLTVGVSNLALVKHVPLKKVESRKWSVGDCVPKSAKRLRSRLSRKLRQSVTGKVDANLFPSWEDPAIAPANDTNEEYVLHECI